MVIKNIILSTCFVGLLSLYCNAQKGNIYSKNAYSFNIKLSEYQVDACLSNLLAAVVKSNKRFYNPNKFFYSLTFNKGNNQKYLNISPEERLNAKDTDYTGFIRIKEVTFLCRGSFGSDSLFKKKSSNPIGIKLKQLKDSADRLPFFVEPSLDGVFYDCKGSPIYVEVYTEGKILGYEKKIHRSDIKQEH